MWESNRRSLCLFGLLLVILACFPIATCGIGEYSGTEIIFSLAFMVITGLLGFTLMCASSLTSGEVDRIVAWSICAVRGHRFHKNKIQSPTVYRRVAEERKIVVSPHEGWCCTRCTTLIHKP